MTWAKELGPEKEWVEQLFEDAEPTPDDSEEIAELGEKIKEIILAPKKYHIHHLQKWIEKIAKKTSVKVFNEGCMIDSRNGKTAETLKIEIYTNTNVYNVFARTDGKQKDSLLECSVRNKGVTSEGPKPLVSGKLHPDTWREISDAILEHEITKIES